ncbi:MAG: XdhC family protein [Candidatus Dormibacteraeota bacterium]|uniref:XdhC family protein n=1 Tax=Candidatus Dormiibacter inghamiae TaxID=3127013 RepID=A0A934KFI8_9BACT|nr:XdhC family protein [Candidatus Dormibacteraeota bacterium]MBJ7606605.1 XdhC family protein [Candidatus Dormibacteraeota bacterium]
MREIAAEYSAWRQDGERLALATVVSTWGSSPRPLGSRLLVSGSGRMAGSVSNGCIEGAVFEELRNTLKNGEARLVDFGVADDLAFEVGLACGGHIQLFLQKATEQHDRAVELVVAERPFTLRTDLTSGALEFLPGPPASELPRRDGDRFEEPFGRPPHLVIIGAIHIAVPLHRLARVMGYRVTVVDARSKFATEERFPEADEMIIAWPDDALKGMEVDRSTAVVILTHDPKFDLPALRSLLKTDAGYLGAIGSRKTSQNRLEQLRSEGFTEEQLARIHGPIGLDLGGRGAEETALAILAELTADRFGGAAARPS